MTNTITPLATTGSPLTDQWLNWVTTTATNYVTANPSYVIVGMNGYYSTTPQETQISMTLTIQLTGTQSDTYSTTRVLGVSAISPISATALAAGDTGSITVTATDPWTATPSAPSWLSVTVTASAVTWTATQNTTGTSRTGTIFIACAKGTTQTFTLTQAG
jgi:hypothetical protein